MHLRPPLPKFGSLLSSLAPSSLCPLTGILPVGREIRALAEEVLQRPLALAPSMSWIHCLSTKESLE